MWAFRVVSWDPTAAPETTALVIGAAVTLSVLVFGGLFYRRQSMAHVHALRPPTRPSPVPEPRPADPFLQGSVRERRGAPRRAGNPTAVLVAAGDPARAPTQALVVDRSLSGVRLSLERQVEPESVLWLRPVSALSETPWVEARVMHCRQTDSHWEAGCRFLRTPSWGVMLHFG